jgi:hypothetical protein
MNAHLWAPWLALPTILALALEVGTFMGDSAIGEMFLNFMLGGNCACLAGVDLTGSFFELQGAPEHGGRYAEGRSGGGGLDGCEVFLYTDNQTVEGSYFRGTFKGRALFELIVTLYKLQM